MVNVKEKLTEIIKEQPDDASSEEIVKELIFSNMVERGLEDSRNDRVISNDDMERRIHSLQK